MPENKLILGRSYLRVAAVLCIAFLLCSLLFVFYMMSLDQLDSHQYLENAADQTKTALDKQLSGDLQTLEGISICLEDLDLSDSDRLYRILRKINDNNDFIRMGFAYPNGNVVLFDIGGTRNTLNVADQRFFQQALAGHNAISETLSDPLKAGNYVNYFGAPVWDSYGGVMGVLCAVGSTDTLREIADARPLNGEGFSDVLGPDGTMIIRSVGSQLTPDFRLKAPDQATVRIADEVLEQVQETFRSGETFCFSYELHGREQLAVISRLEAADWTLFTSVPAHSLRLRYNITAIGCATIIAVACGIFLLLLYQQRRLAVKSQATLVHLAYDDPLTGCWNYARFLTGAPALLKEKGAWAVWYCDLKKFKYLNDVFGYQVGDQLLRDMVRWLALCTRGHGVYCRVSSDHFAGLLSYEHAEELERWFQRLLELMRQDGGEESGTGTALYTELSMGFYRITEADLRDGTPLNTMVNWANMAQRLAKEQPGSHYALFTDELSRQSQSSAELGAAGRTALRDGEFQVYFQPKVNIQDGDRLTGAEALVRWLHPQKGLIPPDRFIPLFEENGLIVDLDRYMFRAVCQWFSGYLAQGRPRINVAVNVSRLSLFQEDFLEHYTAVKEEFGIPDGLVELEFTESLFLGDNDERFTGIVQQLQERGFICSLDDFGSGYSSLNLLKNLSINVLKLDILFFRSSKDIARERIVISNIVNMAKELKISTIAEGVEEPETVDFLRRAGCNIIQGYIFAKPMPCRDFDRLLAEQGDAPMPMTHPG